MNATFTKKRRIWVGGFCFVSLLGVAFWFIYEPTAEREASNKLKLLSEPPQKIRTAEPAEVAKSNSGLIAIRPSNEPEIGLQRLKSIARHTNLELLDSRTLTFNRAVLDLLGVNPTQTEELNVVLRGFLDALKSQELTHAYVTTTSDSGEEIVVAPFDRSTQINKLRGEIARILGKDAGDFVAEQTYYDMCLAVGNSELRLSIESGDDGFDRLVVDQHIRASDALDSETPILRGEVNFAPTSHSKTKSLLGKRVDPRFSHLFSAVDTLPRRK